MSTKTPKTIAQYMHTAAGSYDHGSAGVDSRPGRYFVSVQDGKRRALLTGPYPTHQAALDAVSAVREKACEVDPRGHFYAYGTARLHDGEPERHGMLNRFFGLPEGCK